MPKREALPGDLFAHFGLDAEGRPQSPPEVRLGPVRRATPCRGCGWLRSDDRLGPCPLCRTPRREPSA